MPKRVLRNTRSSGPILLLLFFAATCPAEESKHDKLIVVDDLRFASASLHEYFHRFYDAAEKIGDHPHRPLARSGFDGTVEAHWCTSVGADGRCNCEDRRLEINRHVRMRLTFENGSDDVVKTFWGHAKCYPGTDGWGAAMHFVIQPNERKFGVVFIKEHEFGPRISLQQSGYRTSKRFGQFEYEIKVVREPAVSYDEVELLEAIATPESLRDSMLKAIDRMHELVLVELASERAIEAIYDSSKRPGRRKYSITDYTDSFGEVRERLPKQSHLDAIKQQVDADFDQQRNSARKHFQEFHSAVWRTFPLKECLGKRTMSD